MKNKKITRKITQGVYVLTTNNGGCVVDAVSQISAGDNPLISVAVMKRNYTNELLKNNKLFALSVIGKDANPEIITTFGMNSMRDINKFESISTFEVEGLNIIEDSLGYMVCEIIDSIDNDTHTLFIGRLVEADVIKDEEAMSYQYYQEHKDELVKVTTNNGETAWVCTICGYVYYGEELPDDFKCPKCGVDKSLFEKSRGNYE
ncbi:MAG: flavin reductase [Erysipelotrichales bacterium]|nr:flavin reductase [Erysipelotrichales bacterium]